MVASWTSVLQQDTMKGVDFLVVVGFSVRFLLLSVATAAIGAAQPTADAAAGNETQCAAVVALIRGAVTCRSFVAFLADARAVNGFALIFSELLGDPSEVRVVRAKGRAAPALVAVVAVAMVRARRAPRWCATYSNSDALRLRRASATFPSAVRGVVGGSAVAIPKDAVASTSVFCCVAVARSAAVTTSVNHAF